MSDWKSQLLSKKRTIEDLARFIHERAGGVPNYSFLLGSGASVTSGVRTGSEMINAWLKQVVKDVPGASEFTLDQCRDYLERSSSSWYSRQREYSSLFERCYDLPVQRRIFIEHEVADKRPALGYAYLVSLVDKGYLSTVFTTNFDDLISEAFFQFSKMRPIVCAHDSAISSVSVMAKRPKIIKLHGDYLFDDIKATRYETESLEENMKKKFVEFARDFGLVVAGYSGSDRSIMDPLLSLVRSGEYYKNGIYWCIRKGDVPSEELTKLLWRDRVYWVEVDGFDELLADLHLYLAGDDLPIDTSLVTERPVELVKYFCENEYLKKSASEKVKKDLARLQKISHREQLLGAVRGEKERDDFDEAGGTDLSDSELVEIINIRRQISDGSMSGARKVIELALSNSPSDRFRQELCDLLVTLEEQDGNHQRALDVLDQQISDDQNDVSKYIRKTTLLFDHEKRMKTLLEAESINNNSYDLYLRKLECLIDAYNGENIDSRSVLHEQIRESYLNCISKNPLPNNPAYFRMADFALSSVSPNRDAIDCLKSVASDAEKCFGPNLTSLRVNMLSLSKNPADRKSNDADLLLKLISSEAEKSSKSSRYKYHLLRFDSLLKLKRREELAEFVSEISLISEYNEKPAFLRRIADWNLQCNANGYKAIELLSKCLRKERNPTDAIKIAYIGSVLRNPHLIQDTLDDFVKGANLRNKISIDRYKYLASRKYSESLACLKKLNGLRFSTFQQRAEEVHDLLLDGRYPEARNLGRKLLDSVSWEKREFGQLIINFEIANSKSPGGTFNKGKIKEVLDVTESLHVRFVSNYILRKNSDAEKCLKEIISDDRFDAIEMCSYAIASEKQFTQMIRSELDRQGLQSVRLPGEE